MSLIVLYRGRRGAGKTLTMVKDGMLYYQAGWKVYTNMYSIGYAERLEEDEILSLAESDGFRDCVVMIDEIQTLIDSRRSMRKGNVTFNYFLQQIRKRNVNLLATTQFERRVDIGFREQLDIIASPKMITLASGKKVVEVTYTDLTTEGDGLPPINRKIVYSPYEVFGIYDTEERITAVKTKTKEAKVRDG